MTTQELINKIRPKVGDKNSNKWQDSDIIDVINEGLRDLAKHVNIHYTNKTYPILPYQRKLIIDDEDFIKLKRIRVNNEDIGFVNTDYLDKKISKWEEKTGDSLEYIVYSNQNIRELTLYPLLTETSSDYQSLNDSDRLLIDVPGVSQDTVYGLVTGFDLEDIITPENIYDPEELAGYEPITSISDVFISINIQYYSYPAKTTAVTDELDFDASYMNTLVYYVSGVLLLEDSRTENKQTGASYLQKYAKDSKADIGRNAYSFQDVTISETPYRTGF